MRKLIIVAICACSLVPAFAKDKPIDSFKLIVDKLVKAINEQNYDLIGSDFEPPMQGEDNRRQFFDNLLAKYGKIIKTDKLRNNGGLITFVGHCEHGDIDMTLWLGDNNKITGLSFLPHKPDTSVPVKNETMLSLPFKGKWQVLWGGDTKELNLHNDTPNQKFAFDFVGLDKQGKTHKNKVKVNKDYFAFGRKVLAPADGTVTNVLNGIKDNVPGSTNPDSALGNAVFIQHSDNEVSVLAHLKLNSIKVKIGDEVKKGKVIGLCGNSGNSSEPTLHYHLQNTPAIQGGIGIKCYFEKATVIDGDNKKAQTDYSPVKGDIIVSE